MDESKPRNQFPSWTEAEQEFWLDMFTNFIGIVVDDRLADKSLHSMGWEEGLKVLEADIQNSSLLADIAVLEMQYRFELSGTHKRQDKGRRIVKRSGEAEEQTKSDGE